jgi:hypothetical protein
MLAFFSNQDQATLTEDFEVFRDCGLGYSQRINQLPNTAFPMCTISRAKQANDVTPSGVREDVKEVCHNSVAYKPTEGSTIAVDCLIVR